MVSPKFIGRLGNTMFQTAACIGYARKYGHQWGVPELGVPKSSFPKSSILKHFPNLPRTTNHGIKIKEHPDAFCPVHNVHLDECYFLYHPIPDRGGDVTLVGTWGSYKYFEGQDEEIKKVFALPHIAGYGDYMSIHVRRGDYVQLAENFPPVTTEYLAMAFQFVPAKIAMVFSDDIPWCKENMRIEGVDFEFSEGRNEYQDLSLMASCGHHIIANSTFSWWGAYLGHNPDRIVVSPSCVRGNWSGTNRDNVDLLPPEWIQIKFR